MGSGRGDRNQMAGHHPDVLILSYSASMGSGRGDRNQADKLVRAGLADLASMGSGRGDRNQRLIAQLYAAGREIASMGSGRGDRNQRTVGLLASLRIL